MTSLLGATLKRHLICIIQNFKKCLSVAFLNKIIVNSLVFLLLLFSCGVCESKAEDASTEDADSKNSNNETVINGLYQLNSYATTELDIGSELFNINTSSGNDVDKMIELITKTCMGQCITESNLFVDEFGRTCGIDDKSSICFSSRCIKGCDYWWRALKEFEPCQESCSSTQFYPYDLPCISACEAAQGQYWHLQRLAMKVLVSTIVPLILNKSLTSDFLALQWPITLPDNYLLNRQFNLQYQHALQSASDEPVNAAKNNGDKNYNNVAEQEASNMKYQQWINLANFNCNENFECEIFDALMPYSSYRFRFELPFGENSDDTLYSPATAIYKTQAAGAPLLKPIINSFSALDHSHLALFWQPAIFTNGPLKGFKLKLRNSEETYAFEKWLPANVTQYIFSDLLPHTNYTVQLLMLNEVGEGPFAVRSASTKPISISVDFFRDLSSVVLAGEYSIKLKVLERLAETKVLYQSDQLITDCAVSLSTEQLFLIDEKGTIKRLCFDDSDDHSVHLINKTAFSFKPTKLSVDWLNKRLFIAGENTLTLWSLISTDFDGNSVQTHFTNIRTKMNQMEVDPINGWLFWSHVSGICILNLATNNIKNVYTSSQIGHFHNDFKRFLLVVYQKVEHAFYELSYDGTYNRKLLELNTSREFLGEVQSFIYVDSNIMATNGTHLMRQNYRSNENDVWFLRDLEWCWHLLPVQYKYVQPHPLPTIEPFGLKALLTSNMAKITWNAPKHIHFQSDYAWQHWEYELEMMDVASNSAFNIRNIKSTYFNVEKLQANNLYKIRIRTAASHSLPAGEWSEELLTRTWPLGAHKLMWASANGLYQTNEIGLNAIQVGELGNIRDFVQLNGTMYYITSNNLLKCANIMNPEVSCTFPLTASVKTIAYDWRGGKLYWTDVLKNCLLRANLDGSEKELLQVLEAEHIEIDAYNGYIYYSTGLRLVRRTLSGNIDVEEVEYFHINEFGGTIRGFALNIPQKKLYCVVRQNDGQIRLFTTSLENNYGKSNDNLLHYDIEYNSLRYLHDIESLMWLQLNSSKLNIMRVDTFEIQTIIEGSTFGRVNSVRLKLEYMPYVDVSVIPDPIDISSIRIDDGYWDDFNVKWNSIATAENYTVFYKLLVETLDKQKPQFYCREVSNPFLRITEFNQPDLLLNVTITPYTYWHAGTAIHTLVRSPAAAPTQPMRLRIFVERINRPLQILQNVNAILRWDPPENLTINVEVDYKIYCWMHDKLFIERVYHFSNQRPLEAIISNLSIGETYTFQVQALAAGRLIGGEKTALYALHVNPEVQAVPRLIYTTAEFIAELDMDLNHRKILVHTTSEVDHLAFLEGEERLLWVNENVELMTFVPGSVPVKLVRMRAEVLSLAVDWIRRLVYWAEMHNDLEKVVSVYRLDLCQFEGRIKSGYKLFNLTTGKLLKDLVVLPYSQAVLWLEYDAETPENATLRGRSLIDLNVLKLKSVTASKMFEDTFTLELETVNLIDFRGKICTYDVYRQLCNPLRVYFNIITDNIDEIDRDSGFIYTFKNGTIRAYSRRKQTLEHVADVLNGRKIKARNYQEYPKAKCLLPEYEKFIQAKDLLTPKIQLIMETYIQLIMPDLNTDEDCVLRLPGEKYMLSLHSDGFNVRNFTIFERLINITQLKPFTNYSLQLKASTFYLQKLGRLPLMSKQFYVQTKPGTPTAPENFTAFALSPTEIQIDWSTPRIFNSEKVWYQLIWKITNSTIREHKTLSETSLILTNLMPAQFYTIWLIVFSTENKFNTTDPLDVTTFAEPNSLVLSEQTPNSLTVSWVPTLNIISAVLVCIELKGENKYSVDVLENSTYTVISHLKPKTIYMFYLQLVYNSVVRPYYWPERLTERFLFETLGDKPSSPGQPQIEHIAGEIFKVFWDGSVDNGAPIIEYSLEALQTRFVKRKRRQTSSELNSIILLNNLPWAEEPTPLEDKWIVYCNTIELSCIVRELHTLRLLMFRVRARNHPYGWGPYSIHSERVSEPFVSPEKRNSLVFAIIAPAAIVSCCVIILIIIRMVQKRRLKAKKLVKKGRLSIWSDLSGLQQQQLMSLRSRGFSIASNTTLYTGGPLSDADIALLPHVNWNQITVLNFLGSGAFGEVYEGLVKHDDESQKVAIKSIVKQFQHS
ncbi:protein sevenless isoform X2 [Teleopsis dalmanni]|uniref:protein sevenless isoform X2 n=1 Tax=Teleopsis dalmanni TaxID=139649 RepID=UPI0018CF7593|nr:protein sevenless isoform X2 [Teleopsis dalmanni]